MTRLQPENKTSVRRRFGLQQEILLTLVLLLGAALLFGGFLFLRYAEQNLLNSHLQLLFQGSRSAAMALAESEVLSSDRLVMQRLQTELAADSWWLYDRDLTLLGAVTEQDEMPLGATRLRGLLLQPDQLSEVAWPGLLGLLGAADGPSEAVVATSVTRSARVSGVLVVRFSLEPIRSGLLAAQRWVFLYAFGYGLVLAAAGFLLLRRNVVQPVKNLLVATEKVTGGDLETTLAEDGPLEISNLASSFNLMTDALRQSREQTEEHIQSLKQANDALRQTQEELVRSEKLATVGHLAAGMAHEIGNPLGALTGYLALLQNELPGGTEREVAGHAAAEADRIDRLVRELLDYAAPGKVDPDPIDPWSVVRATIEMLSAQGALKGIELESAEDCPLPEVVIDGHKLTQVLVNLLLNAKDACDEEGGRITLDGETQDDSVCLRVRDNGPGMEPSVMRQLFEPFFTTKAPGKGRGLGLAVCQRVISEAGGVIDVESQPGQGSLFVVKLPVAGGRDG